MICKLEKSEYKNAAALKAHLTAQPLHLSEISICGFADEVLAIKENDDIKAMLCVAAMSYRGKRVLYLFGQAAQSNFENKMQTLYEAALDEYATDTFFILPQRESIDFYKNLGFESAINMRLLSRTIKRNLWARAEVDTITAKKLTELRQRYGVETPISSDAAKTAALMSGLYSNGISTAQTDNAYALFYRRANDFQVVEMYSESELWATQLLEAIADNIGRNSAQIMLSADNPVFAGEGQKYTCGMLFNKVNEFTELYAGPMLY